ncbi:MAG: class I SAM-dependent RNA methyltransferase [Saprospiraceae bacterium]|nr:class I SAM-dependent RNA methyltransferase [Saprospiraceae bacterium]
MLKWKSLIREYFKSEPAIFVKQTNTWLLQYLIKTLFGLESVLAQEIAMLGGEQIEIQNRAVATVGDKALGYRLVYQCRTALAVLTPIKTGVVQNEQQLYAIMHSISWDEVFMIDQTFFIDIVCYSDLFRNSHFLAQKCKDAIVDQFRDKYGRRPSISKDGAIKINVFIKADQVIISLDLAGAPLFKRGYRLETGPAPINEVLAAGLIQLSGWDRKMPLVDPMCGSGTIIMEAALLSRNIPSQYWRSDFSFMHLNNFDPGLWQNVKEDARPRLSGAVPQLIGRDINRHFLNLAKTNAAKAGIEGIQWEKGDFFNYLPQSKMGMLLFNPPYDTRLSLNDAIQFYSRIGDHLKTNFSGWVAWIISSHLQAIKRVGLKPTKKIPLYNGPLDCRFVQFEMYSGSKK